MNATTTRLARPEFPGRIAVLLGAAVLATALHAQSNSRESADSEATIELQEFAVTGSNIRRADVETVLPLSVVDLADLELRAVNTPAELFELLPQAGETVINESSSLGADARGDATSITLRGIGSGNTLVLLNGRRLPAHPISQNDGGTPSLSVNVNVIPSGAVDRIEILRDGASAVYGADAAAGVVNTILKRDLDGLEWRVRVGDSEHNDLREYRTVVSGGQRFNDGRTKLVMVAEYYNRERLPTRKRAFSADNDMRPFAPPPWNGVVVPGVPAGTTNPDNDFENSSTSSQFGNFRRGLINADNSFTGSRPTSNRGIVTAQPNPPSTTVTMSTTGNFFIVPVEAGGVGFKSATPVRDLGSRESDYYQNLNASRTHLPYTERASFYVSLDHRINDRLTAFSDLVYYDAFSQTQREPTAITDASDNNIYMARTNYYNPFGERFYHPNGTPNADGTPRLQGAPADLLIVNHSNDETGPRIIDVDSELIRVVGGLKGRIGESWTWESALLYGKAETRDTEHNALRESKMREAMARTTPDAYNPLGYTFAIVNNLVQIQAPYTNPESVLEFIRDDFRRKGETTLASWDAKASGNLFRLPGGMVQAAVGLEYREETYVDFRPPYAGENPLDDPNPFLPRPVDEGKPDNDFIALSPNFNVDTDRHMIAGFAEMVVPIVSPKQDVKGIYRLEAQLAGRYEDYSDFGDTTKPKYGLTWHPAKSLMVRASYNESFRAPNLAQLFPDALVRSVSGVSDPYRFDVTALTTDGSRNRIAFRSGNTALTPELSETFTWGVVVDVPRIEGLSFSIDYWKLDQKDAFNIFGLTRILRDDRDLLVAETQRQLASGRTISQVELQTATTYLGSPLVIRRPITQADRDAFAAYNVGKPVADQRAPVGEFLRGLDNYFNLSGRELEGIDYSLTYQMPRNSLGRFTFRGEAAYLKTWRQQVLPGDEFDDDRWEDGKPLWKANGSVSWRNGPWSAGLFCNFIGSYEDSSAVVSSSAVRQAIGPQPYISGDNRFIVPAYTTWNLYVGYRFDENRGWLSNTSIRLGSNNLRDKDPPLIDESRGFAVGTANPRGRTFYLDLRKKF